MDDGNGCILLLSILILGVFAYCGGRDVGIDAGKEMELCRVHAEYAKTRIDSLAVVERYPHCAEHYYRGPVSE